MNRANSGVRTVGGDRLVILGTGHTADVGLCYFSEDSGYHVVAFAADEEYIVAETHRGLPVVPLSRLPDLFPPANHSISVQISHSRMNRDRAEKFDQVKSMGYRLANFISSRAAVWADMSTCENCFILESAVIHPFARLGSDVIVSSGAVVAHHAEIGAHSYLASNSAVLGFARVGENSFIGANATVREGITLGRSAFVGANVLANKDLAAETVLISATPSELSRSSVALSSWLFRPVQPKK